MVDMKRDASGDRSGLPEVVRAWLGGGPMKYMARWRWLWYLLTVLLAGAGWLIVKELG
jgi:hypothetical protein